MSLVRRFIKAKEEKKNQDKDYVAGLNFMLYGNSGKSTLVAALTESGKPGRVLELTPAGASTQLEDEYENFMSYPVGSLAELRAVVNSIHGDLLLIKRVGRLLKAKDPKAKGELTKIQKEVEKKGDDFNEVLEMAKAGELPFKAICLAECNIVSGWIEEEVKNKFDSDYMGENKKNMGMDWALLKTEIKAFYQKLLNIPTTVILSTSEYLPSEKQNVSSIVPNLTIGSASREIIDVVGNVFYVTYEDNDYKVYLNFDNRKIFTKQKIKKIKSDKDLAPSLVVSGEPEKLWNYLEEFKKESE
jgi:hypothetical protein